jgi:hypothetical protein
MIIRSKKVQAGFAHVGFLVLAIMVILGIGSVGAYVLSSSKAAGLSSNYADCWIKIRWWVETPGKSAVVIQDNRGPAVEKTVLEFNGFPTAKGSNYNRTFKYVGPNYYKPSILFPVLKATDPHIVYRTATFTANCPNAKSSTGKTWRTYTITKPQTNYNN